MALELKGKVSLDGSGFEAGIAKIQGSIRGLVAEAVTIGAISEAIKKTVEYAEDLVNTSKRLDITIEQLQVLKQAARESGVEFEKLPGLLEKINIARSKALGGDARATAAFGKLGVSGGALQSMSAAEMVLGPFSHAATTHNVQDLNGAFGALGKGLNQIMPLLRTNTEELAKKMQALGLIMSTETAVRLKRVNDEFGLLANLLAVTLAPTILKVVDGLISGIEKFLDFIDKRLGLGGGSSGSSANGLQKVGFGALGAANGLLGLWGEIGANLGVPGAEDKANQRIDRANELFNKAGIGDGIMDSLADQMSKAIKKGKPLGDSFREAMEEFKKQTDAEIERMKHPTAAIDEDQHVSKATGLRRTSQDHADSLIRVGNFLGSSRSTLENIGEKHTHLLTQIERNTRANNNLGGQFLDRTFAG